MDIQQARDNMIKQQIRALGVLNQHTLDLLNAIPRDYFVPRAYQHLAYAEMAVPLEHGQCMLPPTEEARIIDALQIQPNERVLEIGTGSGYFTALLAHQAKHVESVDIFEDFTGQASQKLLALAMHNVFLQTADAAAGYKKSTHYDVIVITGALPFLPKSFTHQLNPKGRLFAFLGQAPLMKATLMTHIDHQQWQTNVLFETFVPSLLNALQPEGFVF